MLHTARKAIVSGAVFAAAALLVQAAAPTGWLLAGSKPANYGTGVDQNAVLGGKPSAYLMAKSDGEGFGTLMQQFGATQYLGKRVRFSAWVKSDSVTRWAGLWMRVDPTTGQNPLAFDNMQDRPIKGTSGWQLYQVVLDVNEKASGIAFGILLDGPGEVWMNSVQVEVVSSATPTTGAMVRDAPANLSFDK